MSTKKYTTVTGASKATVHCDMQYLAEKGIVASIGGGRSRHCQIKL